MNCQELTDLISNIKAQISELDSAVNARNPERANQIMKTINKLFDGELKKIIDLFFEAPSINNYRIEVERIIKKIGDRDPAQLTFSKKELVFIYGTNIDIFINMKILGVKNDQRLLEIRNKRAKTIKEDLSKATGIPRNKISVDAREILNKTGEIELFYCDETHMTLARTEGIVFPREIIGGVFLDIRSMDKADGLKLPEKIVGGFSVDTRNLIEGLVLPNIVCGTLILQYVTSAEGIEFPDTVMGDIYLLSLTSVDGLELPENYSGTVRFYALDQDEAKKFEQKYPYILFKSKNNP